MINNDGLVCYHEICYIYSLISSTFNYYMKFDIFNKNEITDVFVLPHDVPVMKNV